MIADSEATQMMAGDNTDPTLGDRNRDGSGGAPTDILVASPVDVVNTPVSSPQRQQGERSPMKTPPSQRRQTKSQRLAPENDEISGDTTSATNVDINNVAVIAAANNVSVNTTDHSESTANLDENPYHYSHYTDDEIAVIEKIQAVMREQYPPGDRTKTWPTLVALKDDINRRVGDRFGFKVSTFGSSAACVCRAPANGYIKHQEQRSAVVPEHKRRTRKTNKLGCIFAARTGHVGGRKGPVYITAGEYLHTHGCRPCAQQLLISNISGGAYTASDSMRDGLQTLMDMMRYEQNLSSKTVRKVLKEKLPQSVPVTAALIANVRVRLKNMLFSLQTEEDDEQRKLNNQLKLTTEDSTKLMEAAKADAANGALCSEELDHPEYANIATEQLKVMLREALSQQGDDLKKIVTLLESARNKDPAFDFRIGRDAVGDVTAIVWQDGIMRGHCSRLLDVVMLDMMKRRQNSIDWPYCGPVLITGEKKIATACEAIIVTESIDAYVFVMNSTYEMSGVNRSVTRCIFADGIMSVSLLRRLGIEDSCNLILDRYHIVEVDWPKAFGWHYFKIKDLMKRMVESNSEDDFMTRFEDVRRRCPVQSHQEYLMKEVYAHRKHFVSFWTQKYSGHLDRLGNQGSESNHSSYCQRISFGAMVEPAEQLVDCLERSKDLAKELNVLRYKTFTANLEKRDEIMSNKNATEEEKETAIALVQLSPEGLEQWAECNAELPHYSMGNQEGSDCKLIYRHLDQLQSPRVVGPNKRCTECKRSIATNNSLCVHELMYDGGKFNKGRFSARYHALNKVECIDRVSVPNDSNANADEGDAGHGFVGNEDPFSLHGNLDGGGAGVGMPPAKPSQKYDDTKGQLGEVAVIDSSLPAGAEDGAGAAVIPAVAVMDTNTTVETLKRRSYIDMMQYFESFAKIIANHPQQKECIGALEALKAVMSGEVVDENMSLEQHFHNFIHQFGASLSHDNMFGGKPSSLSSTLEGAKFSAVVQNNSKQSFKVSLKRLKPAVEDRQQMNGKTKSPKTCSFCQDIEQHRNRSSCPKYGILKPNLVEHKSNRMAILRQQLGDPMLHEILQCPPEIERNILHREKSETPVQPWPIDASHMTLKALYYDCNVVAIKTRFAPPPSTDSGNNIVAVQFLCTMGANPMVNSTTKNTLFYYRAREVRDFICHKMTKKKLLFDCMESANKLG